MGGSCEARRPGVLSRPVHEQRLLGSDVAGPGCEQCRGIESGSPGRPVHAYAQGRQIGGDLLGQRLRAPGATITEVMDEADR